MTTLIIFKFSIKFKLTLLDFFVVHETISTGLTTFWNFLRSSTSHLRHCKNLRGENCLT
jgi:hypothetical protein